MLQTGSIILATILAFNAWGQTPTPTPTPAPTPTPTPTPTPVTPRVVKAGTSETGRLMGTITVAVEGWEAWRKDHKDVKVIPYLDNRPLTGIEAILPTAGDNRLQFDLKWNDKTEGTWKELLKRQAFTLNLTLSVGPEGGPAWPTEVHDFQFQRLNSWWLTGWVAFFLFAGAGFYQMATRGDILRESGQDPPSGKRKAYSLARTQMAFWTFIVAISFVLIWMVSWNENTITPQVLVLLGISSATALGAVTVDTAKQAEARSQKDALEKEQAQLAALPNPTPEQQARMAQIVAALATANAVLSAPETSGHFLMDILSDVNGLTFHRFQSALWTLIVGIVFLVEVGTGLTMPNLDSNLLILMGISNGTYIGFKFPEVKN